MNDPQSSLPFMKPNGEPRSLWFVVYEDPPRHPLKVTAYTGQNINDLRNIIHLQRPDILPSEMLLWKVNIPISISRGTQDEIEAFAKTINSIRLPDRCSPGNGEVFQFLDGPHLVSSYWNANPAQGLHIIVQSQRLQSLSNRADPAPQKPAKRAKLTDESEGFLDTFTDIRNQLWGKNIFKRQISAGTSFLTLDLLPAKSLHLNPRSIKTLLVRDEYELAYNAIVKTKRNFGGRIVYLVTGQPGIGKTLFLFYFLVRLLQEKQVVALQINADQFVLFDKGGASLHDKESTFAIPAGAWTLSDSSGDLSLEPCTAFQYGEGHIVHTSPPSARRWKEWVKKLAAMRHIMDVWSLEEFRRLLTISELNILRGETLFRKYGSNVRAIIDMFDQPELEDFYDRDVRAGAAAIAKDFVKIFDDLKNLDFTAAKLFSEIFTVRPNNLVSRLDVLTIPTPYIFKALALEVFRQPVAEQRAIFTTLASYPSLATAAGWWFEIYAHISLSDPTRNPIQTHIRGVSDSSPIPAPMSQLSGNDKLRKIQPPFNFYWRPREPKFEGIDGLIRIGNHVRVLQYTTSSSHRSTTKGLDEIRKVMNHIRGVEWDLNIVGPDLAIAESARDSHRLTGDWAEMPIYACELQVGMLDKKLLDRFLAETKDDTYPEYRMDSTGVQFGFPPSAPGCVPSGSTGHGGMGSTGAPHHQSAQVSTQRKGSFKGQSNTRPTRSAAPADRVPPRRSSRLQK